MKRNSENSKIRQFTHSKFYNCVLKTLYFIKKWLECTTVLSDRGSVLSDHGSVLSDRGAVLSDRDSVLSDRGAVLSDHGSVLPYRGSVLPYRLAKKLILVIIKTFRCIFLQNCFNIKLVFFFKQKYLFSKNHNFVWVKIYHFLFLQEFLHKNYFSFTDESPPSTNKVFFVLIFKINTNIL